jgi:[NiFe] hydrogenase assembly HybE family chaperone
MHWQNLGDLTQTLETCFTHIYQQRMAGIPILNPVLRVQAVDFQLYQQIWLGVLISPWFMNILFMRDDGFAVGTKVMHSFPAGQFEFTVAFEDALGFYQTCSLYSPMFDFDQQDTAVQTAQAALQALLQVPDRPNISRRDLLRGHISKRDTP